MANQNKVHTLPIKATNGNKRLQRPARPAAAQYRHGQFTPDTAIVPREQLGSDREPPSRAAPRRRDSGRNLRIRTFQMSTSNSAALTSGSLLNSSSSSSSRIAAVSSPDVRCLLPPDRKDNRLPGEPANIDDLVANNDARFGFSLVFSRSRVRSDAESPSSPNAWAFRPPAPASEQGIAQQMQHDVCALERPSLHLLAFVD